MAHAIFQHVETERRWTVVEKLAIFLCATTPLEELTGRLHPDLLLHTALEVIRFKQRDQLLLAL